MISHLRRLFRPTPRLNVFAFKGNHGLSEFRDPAVIRRRLNTGCPNWADLCELVMKTSKPLPEALGGAFADERQRIAEDAVAELAGAVGAAFDLPALDGGGAGYSEAERIGVLAQYLAYCSRLLEQTLPKPSGPAPTAVPASN